MRGGRAELLRRGLVDGYLDSVRRSATALILTALSMIAAAPAAAAPLVDAPGALPEPPSPVLIDRAQDDGALSLERATLYRVYAVTDDDRLPAAYESEAPFDGTFLLKQAREDLALMDPGPARREVAATLRAPPDPNPAFCDVLSVSPLPNSVETTHFYIQYNALTLDPSLSIEDYKQALETAWGTEIGAFGWAAPPASPAAASALGGKYHVRIDALAPLLYGFVSTNGTYTGQVGNNPNTSWNDVDADATCMGLNQSYSAFPGTPRGALDATTAHEFNHSLQFGYGALSGANEPDLHYAEGGSSWMEDEVQDASNDNYNYLYPEFESSMGEHQGDAYAYWLTFRGLTERFGTNAAGAGEDVMQEFWELTSKNEADSLTAMQGALAKKEPVATRKPIALARGYHDYAIAAKFVKSCAPGGYALPLCFEEGNAYKAAAGGEPAPIGTVPSIGAGYSGAVEDNYALNWVALPVTSSYDLTVANTSAGGLLRVSLACDTGTAVALAPVPVTLGPGAASTVPGFNPAGCQQAIAVITNESQTAPDPSSSAAQPYTVSTAAALPVTTPVVPPPGTGSSAGATSDNINFGTPVTPAPGTGPKARVSRLVFGEATVRRNGTVLIRVRVSGAGTLKATARARVRSSLLSRLRRLTVARRTVRPRRAGVVTLRLKAGRRARRAIRRNEGRLRARTTLVFTPRRGARRTKARTITFRLGR